MADDVTIDHYGDVELWYATGTIPEGRWSLPLHVRRYKDKDGSHYCRVSPIHPITRPQVEILRNLIGKQNLWDRQDVFVLPKDYFEHRCKKAEGITPEYYRIWPGETQKLPVGPDNFKAESETLPSDNDTDAFIKWVSDRRGIKLSMLKLVFFAICSEAPKWMLEKKRPISFGFMKLFAFPYRVNWKQILLAKAPWSSSIFDMPKEDWEAQLIRSEFMPMLCQPENMAMNQNDQIKWSLEVVPTKEWNDKFEKMEQAALLHGHGNYVSRYEKLILDLKESIIEVYASFIAQMGFALGQLFPGFVPGSRRLGARKFNNGAYLSELSQSPKKKSGDPSHDCCVLVADPNPHLAEQCIIPDLPEKTLEMQEVPHLLPPVKDVWERTEQRALAESPDKSD